MGTADVSGRNAMCCGDFPDHENGICFRAQGAELMLVVIERRQVDGHEARPLQAKKAIRVLRATDRSSERRVGFRNLRRADAPAG